MGRAFFTVIAAISQLERELIVERVKNGLKNARAKGKLIGRAKTRPSEIIRALRASGMSFRSIAQVSRTSQGSVGAEIKAWRIEAQKAGKTLEEAIDEYNIKRSTATKKTTGIETSPVSTNGTPQIGRNLTTGEIELTISANTPDLKLELVR